VVLFPTRQILTTDFRINTDQKIKKPDPLSSVASVSSVVLFSTLQILTTDFRINTDQKIKKPDPLSSVASVSSVVLFPTLQILTTDFTDEHRSRKQGFKSRFLVG
jgi:ABC-type transport system involved in Fe-S cluster assembly fused permease/ATPase subunit